MLRLEFAGRKAYHGGNFSNILKSVFCGAVLSSGEGQSWRRAPPGFRFLIFRRCFQSDGAVSRRKLLIYTAANNEKEECGRTLRLADTAANEKRQSCGRAERTTLSVILFAKTEKEPKRFFKQRKLTNGIVHGILLKSFVNSFYRGDEKTDSIADGDRYDCNCGKFI